MRVIDWVIANKDFFIVVAALISPFAAAFAVLRSSRIQASSAALRDARQRGLEKLRDELAAQVFCWANAYQQLKNAGTDKVGKVDWDGIAADSDARTARIELLVPRGINAPYGAWCAAAAKCVDALSEWSAGSIPTTEQRKKLLQDVHALTITARELVEAAEEHARVV